MTCRHCQPFLSPYLDGVLSPQEREEVGAHLSQCLVCTQHFQQLKRNRQLIHALPAIELTAKMQAQLQAKIQSLKSKVQSRDSATGDAQQATRKFWWNDWRLVSFGSFATAAASILFYFAMMQSPSPVSAEEVVSSMDQLISTLDSDEGERVIGEETPDEVLPDWFNETDRELFENDNEQD